MTTVPKSDTPAPANNAQTKLVSDSMSGNYGRPASGGAPQPGKPEGNPDSTGAGVPGGVTPSMDAYNPAPYRGEIPGHSGTMVGPDFGHGATQVNPDSGDRPSGGKAGADRGTVGDSGPQGPGPGAAGFTETGRDE